MAQTKATLPPLAGFVETRVLGEAVYRSVTTGVCYPPEAVMPTAEVQASDIGRDRLLIDHEFRLTLLELGVQF